VIGAACSAKKNWTLANAEVSWLHLLLVGKACIEDALDTAGVENDTLGASAAAETFNDVLMGLDTDGSAAQMHIIGSISNMTRRLKLDIEMPSGLAACAKRNRVSPAQHGSSKLPALRSLSQCRRFGLNQRCSNPLHEAMRVEITALTMKIARRMENNSYFQLLIQKFSLPSNL